MVHNQVNVSRYWLESPNRLCHKHRVVRLRHTNSGLVIVFVGLANLLAIPRTPSAFELTVRARTNLTVDVDAQGRRVVVEGTVRDNIYQGLGGRLVTVNFVPLTAESERFSVDVETGPNGRFRVAERLEEGRWFSRAVFEGGNLYDRSFGESEFDVARELITLDVTAPVAWPYWVALPIEVRGYNPTIAFSSRPIQIEFNGALVEEHFITGASGHVTAQITPPSIVGNLSVTVRFVGDPTFASAAATVETLLYEEAVLSFSAQAMRQRGDDELAIEGQLLADTGPIEEAPIQLHFVRSDPEEEIGTWTVITDEEGNFELVHEVPDLRPGDMYLISAQFDPRGDGDTALLVTANRQITIRRTALDVVGKWAPVGAMVFLVIVLISVGVRRTGGALSARRLRKQHIPKPGHDAPSGLVELSRPQGGPVKTIDRIGGTVFDADSQNPIEHGEVHFSNKKTEENVPIIMPIAANGGFTLGPLDRGTYRLVATAPGYLPTAIDARIPHRGEYSDLEMYICSVRSWVRYIYRRLAQELDLGNDRVGKWGWSTPKQIETLIMGGFSWILGPGHQTSGVEVFRRSIEEVLSDPNSIPADRLVRALTLLVEEVVFSNRLYNADMVELCQTLTAGVDRLSKQRDQTTRERRR